MQKRDGDGADVRAMTHLNVRGEEHILCGDLHAFFYCSGDLNRKFPSVFSSLGVLGTCCVTLHEAEDVDDNGAVCGFGSFRGLVPPL